MGGDEGVNVYSETWIKENLRIQEEFLLKRGFSDKDLYFFIVFRRKSFNFVNLFRF